MLDVVINLVFGSTSVELTPAQYLCAEITACVLVVLCFSYISISLYKLFRYIVKF